MKKFEIAVMASSLVNPLAIKRRIQSELSASGIDRFSDSPLYQRSLVIWEGALGPGKTSQR